MGTNVANWYPVLIANNTVYGLSAVNSFRYIIFALKPLENEKDHPSGWSFFAFIHFYNSRQLYKTLHIFCIIRGSAKRRTAIKSLAHLSELPQTH